MISTGDIGRVAADQLMAGGSGQVIVELAGPEEYSPEVVRGTSSLADAVRGMA